MKKERKFFLDTIYFYLTKGCNLSCRHCWINPKYQNGQNSYPSLSLELFRSIIIQAKPLGLSKVKLTGGEPLLHPEIHEILKEIRSNGLRLIVETNGLLCTEDLAREIAVCKNPFASVSLDGASAETHEWVRGISGCFERALEGIQNLVKAGLKPQIIMTVMRRNKNEIDDIVRLAESLGAGSVKFNLLQPIARGEKMREEKENLTIEEIISLGKYVENTLSALTKLRLIFDYPLAFCSLGKMFGDNGDRCGTCGILGILGVLANGSYALCGIGEIVPELIFGHTSKDRLEDIWRNNSVLNELREGLPHRLEGICGECLMKNRCLGGCIAQNYYRSRNLWASFWFCEEAARLGIFPESRMRMRESVRFRAQSVKLKCKV